VGDYSRLPHARSIVGNRFCRFRFASPAAKVLPACSARSQRVPLFLIRMFANKSRKIQHGTTDIGLVNVKIMKNSYVLVWIFTSNW
jgi:hypothetical protein